MYFHILDTVKMSISERFVPNKELLMDIAWLDPSKYKEIASISLEEFPSNLLLTNYLYWLKYIGKHYSLS